MNATPHINEALQTTAIDLRALGEAAKTDFQRISHDARELAQEKVIKPSLEAVKDTTARLEEQARRTTETVKENIDHLRNYAVENPGRALAGALAGGVILGLLLRR